MADSHSGRVLGQLHHWLGSKETPADDGKLLERFVHQRDEDAFAELVARHGPLVFGLCRRLLGNVQDAEDVFQATFLVLARKAATIRKPESLSCWLHGVAYRLALKAKDEANKRRIHEQQAPPRRETVEIDLSWREVRGLIDEELQHLPEKQRLPLVLCYLEGLTQDEASRRLGWPRGTLKRRLEAGRERLRIRLTRRGVTLGVSLFAAALAESVSRGAVPVALRSATVRAAMQFSMHETAALAGTTAALLAEGVLQTMLTTKLKLGAMLVLLLGCAATVAGLAVSQAPQEKQPENKVAAPASARPAEDKHVRKDRYGDLLPPSAIARLGTLRMRHRGMTADAVFTPDAKTVIVSDWGGEVVFWDVATGKAIRRLRVADSGGSVLALALQNDGKTLATGGFEFFSLWDVETGKKLSQTAVPGGNLWQILFTPDGKTLIFHNDNRIYLWNVSGNKKRHELKEHTAAVSRLALSPDGKTLASVTRKDRHIRLWDVASGKEKSSILAYENGGLYIAFSPDGKTLASAGFPYGGLCLWDAASAKKLRQLPIDPFMFAFFPDGKTMAGLELSGHLSVYDLVRGKRLRQFDAPSGHLGLTIGEGHWAGGLVISPDGKTVATLGAGPNSFDLGDAARGRLLHSFEGHRHDISGLVFAANGKSLFSSAFNETVLVWDAASGALHGSFANEDEAASGKPLALSPDGKLMMAGSKRSGKLILWDTASRKAVRRCVGPDEFIVAAAWSADGKTLASMSQESVIRVWDPATGKQRQVIAAPRQSLRDRIALSPDGSMVAACPHGRGTIFLWATDSGKELRRIETSHGVVTALAFSPDGAFLISGGTEGGICLWKPTTGTLLGTCNTSPTVSNSLIFSRDGRTIVSGQSDSSVRLWETASGRERACFRGHRGAVQAVGISRDGRRIASGSADTTILIWDATGGARPDAALSAERLQTLWSDLRDTDAGRAYRALWQLALSPKQALPFLTDKLRLAVPLDAAQQKRVDRLLVDLDSEQFAIRQQAETELEKTGLIVEPALHKALESKPSLEVRRRIEKVLAKLASERLRITRALEALEHMNISKAQRLLESLANGAPRAWLTEEARAIRKRRVEHPVTP